MPFKDSLAELQTSNEDLLTIRDRSRSRSRSRSKSPRKYKSTIDQKYDIDYVVALSSNGRKKKGKKKSKGFNQLYRM